MDRFIGLDSTAHDLLFSCLSIADLYALLLTSHVYAEAVQGYYKRAFNIYRHLQRFFPTVKEVDAFRVLQSKTETLISGSSALQFLDRSFYPDSDLDVYVEWQHILDVVHFFESTGWTYVPRDEQKSIAEIVKNLTTSPHELTDEYGSLATVSVVINFMRNNVKMQLVATETSPLECILHFHSTVVMNFISHANAYSLFPRATFIDRKALVVPTQGTSQEDVLDKYRSRGWVVGVFGMSHRAATLSSDFAPGRREIGDRKTWVMQLPGDFGNDKMATKFFYYYHSVYGGAMVYNDDGRP